MCDSNSYERTREKAEADQASAYLTDDIPVMVHRFYKNCFGSFTEDQSFELTKIFLAGLLRHVQEYPNTDEEQY